MQGIVDDERLHRQPATLQPMAAAAWRILNGTATLTNCTVSGNATGPYGGGGGLYNFDGTATLTNCTVSGNSAGTYGGGGLYNQYGTTTLTNCTVSGKRHHRQRRWRVEQ